jgi:hypothetical protein
LENAVGWDGFAVPLLLQFRAAVAGSAVIGILLTPFIRIDQSPLFGFVRGLLATGPVAAVGAVLRALVSGLTGRLLMLDSTGVAELVVNSGLSTCLGLVAATVVRPRTRYAYLQVWFFVAGMLLAYSAIIDPGQPARADGDARWASGNSSEVGPSSRPPGTLAPTLADTPTPSAPPSRTEASDLAVTATPGPPLTPTTNPMPTATSTPTSVPTPTLAPTSSPTPRPTATPWPAPTPTAIPRWVRITEPVDGSVLIGTCVDVRIAWEVPASDTLLTTYFTRQGPMASIKVLTSPGNEYSASTKRSPQVWDCREVGLYYLQMCAWEKPPGFVRPQLVMCDDIYFSIQPVIPNK